VTNIRTEPSVVDEADDAVRSLRAAGLWEGLSLLALLSIAMPLKYFFAFPLAVRVTGTVHGLFFLWFVYALGRAHFERGWGIGTSLRLFIGAIVPFGFLAVDRALRGPLGQSRPASADLPGASVNLDS